MKLSRKDALTLTGGGGLAAAVGSGLVAFPASPLLLPVGLAAFMSLWAMSELSILLLQDYLPLVTTPLSWVATLPDMPMSLPFIAIWCMATAWRYGLGRQKFAISWGMLLNLLFIGLVAINYLAVAIHSDYADSKFFLVMTIDLFSFIAGATFARYQFPRVFRWILVLGLVVAGLTYWAFLHDQPILPGRYSAFDMNPIWACRIVLLGAATSFALMRRKIWGWAYLFAIVPATVLTGSRGPIVAAVMTAMLMLAVHAFLPATTAKPTSRPPSRGRPGAIARIALGLVLAVGLAGWLLHAPAAHAEETRNLENTETFSSRAFLYERAWEGFSQHFLLGVGLGGFEDLVSQTETGEKIIFPHNMFLEVAVELGIFGLLTLFAMVGHYLWLGYDHLRYAVAHPRDPTGVWGVAATAGFLNLFMAAQFSGDLVSNHSMWFFMGLMTGVQTLRMGESRS